jgi:hypothetical protein
MVNGSYISSVYAKLTCVSNYVNSLLYFFKATQLSLIEYCYMFYIKQSRFFVSQKLQQKYKYVP